MLTASRRIDKCPNPGQRFSDKFPTARTDKMTNTRQMPQLQQSYKIHKRDGFHPQMTLKPFQFNRLSATGLKNNGQQVAGHDDRAKYFLARTNPDPGRSNNEYCKFFWPKEYRITLAIDRFHYIDVHILDSKLVKNAFTSCRVPFYSFCMFNVRSTLRIIVWRCLKSLKVKSEA